LLVTVPYQLRVEVEMPKKNTDIRRVAGKVGLNVNLREIIDGIEGLAELQRIPSTRCQ
jgi:hypothetical protein